MAQTAQTPLMKPHLLYFAVEDDFNGEVWPSANKPNKFNGEMRQTLLMPMAVNLEEIEKQ